MNVVILTEGGKNYGLGHVARCCSIYQAFEEYDIFPGTGIIEHDAGIISNEAICCVKKIICFIALRQGLDMFVAAQIYCCRYHGMQLDEEDL